MTEHFDDEKDEIIDGDITEKNDGHEDDSDYAEILFSLSSSGEPRQAK